MSAQFTFLVKIRILNLELPMSKSVVKSGVSLTVIVGEITDRITQLMVKFLIQLRNS